MRPLVAALLLAAVPLIVVLIGQGVAAARGLNGATGAVSWRGDRAGVGPPEGIEGELAWSLSQAPGGAHATCATTLDVRWWRPQRPQVVVTEWRWSEATYGPPCARSRLNRSRLSGPPPPTGPPLGPQAGPVAVASRRS